MSKSSAPMPQPSAAIIVLISSLPSLLRERALPPRLGRPPCRLALDDVQRAKRRIPLLAVGELAGQRTAVERGLAADQIARLARRPARPRRGARLADERPS